MSAINLSKYKMDSIVIDEGIYSVGFYFVSTILLGIIGILFYYKMYLYIILPIAIIALLLNNKRSYRNRFCE